MKILLNIFESILLSIAVLLVVLCMTILNKRYVKFVLEKTSYYQVVTDDLNEHFNNKYSFDKNTIKNDMNNYIDNYYIEKEYSSKVEYDNKELTEYYNNKIKFIGPFNNFRIKKDIIDICTIVIISIVGLLFMKTKFRHNLDMIAIISGIIGCGLSFFIYFNSYEGILSNLIKGVYYIYLGLNILLFLYPLYSRGYKAVVNKGKNKK